MLVWGMALSMAVLVLGLFLYALSPTGHAEVDLSIPQIIDGIMNADPIAVIDLGILLLIATPLTRVVTALAVFIVDRDLRFVLVALLVLAVIAIAIALR